jgi:hypothetical protein
MGLDLSNSVDTAKVEDEGIRITLLDETDEPYMDGDKPVTALVAGTYSKRFTKAQQKINDKAARSPGKQTPEQRDQNGREQYAACVIEWDLEFNGKMAPPAEIFARKPHIYAQIIQAANNHAAFFEQRSTP